MFQNVVVGKPILDPSTLISSDHADWEENECAKTLFTEERFLPRIMVEAGIVSSASEVRRNRPELVRQLDKPDCFWVKWGKKRLYVVVGE